jgi:hypothetical protein
MSSPPPALRIIEAERSEEIDSCGMGDVRALVFEESLTIRGWAIGARAAAAKVKVTCAGSDFEAEAPIRLSRPDVTLAVGDGHPEADTPGFVLELVPSGSGTSEFLVAVEFVDGSSCALGRLAVGVTTEADTDGLKWSPKEVSSERENVVVGKEGWLFLRQDTNDVIGQHTGRVKLDREQRDRWRSVLASRVKVARELGATWLCLVAPDKEAVYAEYLPDDIVPAPTRTIHQFLALADEVDAPVIYALEGLTSAKDQGPLFVKTDTHWNQRGAFVAYRLICRVLGEKGLPAEPVDEAAVKWSTEVVQGDLGAKLYPDAVSSEVIRASLDRRHGALRFDNKVLNHGRVIILEQESEDLPTCVVFGESFAKNLLIFLQASFRRVVFVHTSMFIREIVERERPDVVLSIPVERFLLRVPDDEHALERLEATAAKKGGELPWPVGQLGIL